MDSSEEITLVTAADKGYFLSLISLLESMKRNSPRTKCIVFDLGLRFYQKKWVRNLSPLDIHLLDVSNSKVKFDGWDALGNSGCFAWKPAVLELVGETHNNLVWADAGGLITRELEQLEIPLKSDGVFLIRNYQHKNENWTSEDCKKIMGVNSFELNSSQVMGNFFALSLINQDGHNLFNEWITWSSNPLAIKGDRSNHRHDQTILSIMAARHHSKLTEPQGHTRIGRFGKDYRLSLSNGEFFLSHRRWISLFPINLVVGRKLQIIYLLPVICAGLTRQVYWRLKWRIRRSEAMTRVFPLVEE